MIKFSKWNVPATGGSSAPKQTVGELGTTRHCCAPRRFIARSFEMRWTDPERLGHLRASDQPAGRGTHNGTRPRAMRDLVFLHRDSSKVSPKPPGLASCFVTSV